jgi:predicted HTH domain antitoxin
LSEVNALKIEVELPRDLMVALNIPESELAQRAKEWVVLELFQEGEISAGKAAEILGLSKVRFLDLLDQRRLPYLDGAPVEFERDVAAATGGPEDPGLTWRPFPTPGS